MNKLHGIILVMVAALLILSIGIALGVTYPINNTISQQNDTNVTQEPIETVGPITTTIGPADTVTESVEETVEPTDTETVEPTETESEIPKETPKSPGFDIILVIWALSMIYIFRQRR